MSRAGGSSLSRCESGLASSAVDLQAAGAQPRYLPGAEFPDESSEPESGALAKLNIPYHVTSPWTQSDCVASGDSGSGLPCFMKTGASDESLHVVAASAASCPPAEPPQMMARLGSMSNCV